MYKVLLDESLSKLSPFCSVIARLLVFIPIHWVLFDDECILTIITKSVQMNLIYGEMS